MITMKIIKTFFLAVIVCVFIVGVSQTGSSALNYYADSTITNDSVYGNAKDSLLTDSVKVSTDTLQAEKQLLAEGEALYEKKCQKCHELHSPSEYDMSQWDEILPVMKDKAKLTKSEYKLIHAYIKTNSKK